MWMCDVDVKRSSEMDVDWLDVARCGFDVALMLMWMLMWMWMLMCISGLKNSLFLKSFH